MDGSASHGLEFASNNEIVIRGPEQTPEENALSSVQLRRKNQGSLICIGPAALASARGDYYHGDVGDLIVWSGHPQEGR